MSMTDEYHAARRDEDTARLRRALALRAMSASGMSQRQVAEALGVSQPAILQQAAGSVARHEAGAGSDIDLLVPDGTSTFDFIHFKQLLEAVLGREIDLVDVGGLTAGTDDDTRREAIALWGSLEGSVSDDFDAPLEDFADYS